MTINNLCNLEADEALRQCVVHYGVLHVSPRASLSQERSAFICLLTVFSNAIHQT